jgi:hypothetical protein
MVVSMPTSRGGTGLWSRWAIAVQVFGVVGFAAAACVLASYLASLPLFRARIDLTAVRSNTLDETLGGLIEQLPDKATIDIFFRSVDPPLSGVGFQAQQRMHELLFVARNQFPDKLRVVDHDLSDIAKVGVRMRELGIEEDNVVVVSRGSERAVLKLLRDIARVDPGNPTMKVPPSLESFRGEEALGSALLRVSIDETPRIAFTVGHGERDLYDVDKPRALGKLRSALAADGFVTERWDSTQSARIPEATRVVAVVDPAQPFTAAELDEIARFVERGGRLFVAPSSSSTAFGAPGGAEDLLARFGIQSAGGFVAMPVPDGFGGWRMGIEQCGTVVCAGSNVELRHPVTEALARAEARVGLTNVRAFAIGSNKPTNAVAVDLLRSPEIAWRDLPGSTGAGDWKFDARTEEQGPFVLALALAFTPQSAAGDAAHSERASARVLAVGSGDVLSNDLLARNRDFVLNAFNWLAQRDRRLAIRPRVVERRLLDLSNTRSLATLNLMAWILLPALTAALGVVTALRRRR